MSNEKNILKALRDGNVPEKNIKDLCVGRDKEIIEFKKVLNEVKYGESYTKFVNGRYGSGKTFFLKVIQEISYEEDFLVSNIVIGDELPFHKIELIYASIVNSLRCKTGIGLKHVINRWLTRLEADALEEVDESNLTLEQIIKENINNDLEYSREYSNSFTSAVASYYRLKEEGDIEGANFAQAWLRGDEHIPAVQKKKFGVKGEINRDNVFDLLTALSLFTTSLGYSGLVILIDEAEFITQTKMSKSRDVAYDYIRKILEKSDNNEFNGVLFVFAGTSDLFIDDETGIPSYPPLDNRISNVIESEYDNLRNPIIELKGLQKEDLKNVSIKIIQMHSNVYQWDTSSFVNILDEFINSHHQNTTLTNEITPRKYFKSLVTVLDIVEQHHDILNNKNKIIELFNKNEIDKEEDNFEDW